MMNKTINGRSALLALLLLCLSLFILTVPKAADASGIGNARVIDEADLLTDAARLIRKVPRKPCECLLTACTIVLHIENDAGVAALGRLVDDEVC